MPYCFYALLFLCLIVFMPYCFYALLFKKIRSVMSLMTSLEDISWKIQCGSRCESYKLVQFLSTLLKSSEEIKNFNTGIIDAWHRFASGYGFVTMTVKRTLKFIFLRNKKNEICWVV